MFGWLRRKKANNDYRTRLDCRELNELRHHVGNANLGLARDWKLMLRAIPEAYAAVIAKDTDRALAALNALNDAFLRMRGHIRRIDTVLKTESPPVAGVD